MTTTLQPANHRTAWARQLPPMQRLKPDVVADLVDLVVLCGTGTDGRMKRLVWHLNPLGANPREPLFTETRPRIWRIDYLAAVEGAGVIVSVLEQHVSRAPESAFRVVLEWVHDPDRSYLDRCDSAYKAAEQLLLFIERLQPGLNVEIAVIGISDIQKDGRAVTQAYGTITSKNLVRS
jgi:hypothetical protein